MDIISRKTVLAIIAILLASALVCACEEDECPESARDDRWCEDNKLMYCDGRVFPFDKSNEIRVLDDCSTNGYICVETSEDTATCVEPDEFENHNDN